MTLKNKMSSFIQPASAASLVGAGVAVVWSSLLSRQIKSLEEQISKIEANSVTQIAGANKNFGVIRTTFQQIQQAQQVLNQQIADFQEEQKNQKEALFLLYEALSNSEKMSSEKLIGAWEEIYPPQRPSRKSRMSQASRETTSKKSIRRMEDDDLADDGYDEILDALARD